MAEPTDPITPELARYLEPDVLASYERSARHETALAVSIPKRGLLALTLAARRSLEYEAFFREHARHLLLEIDNTGQRDSAPILNARLKLSALLSRVK